jgi:hypothetical protein
MHLGTHALQPSDEWPGHARVSARRACMREADRVAGIVMFPGVLGRYPKGAEMEVDQTKRIKMPFVIVNGAVAPTGASRQ